MEQLINEMEELRQKVAELEKVEQNHEKVEKKLKETEYKLGERVKELNCLYGIIELIKNPNYTIKNILMGSLEKIKNNMRFPEICRIQIVFNNKEYTTGNFSITPWKMSNKIVIQNKELSINVYYLEKNSFLREERKLIKEVAELLKAIFEFKLVWI